MKYPIGIMPALVTPLDENEKLNVESFKGIIEYVLDAGVHGLFVLGSTGESYAFGLDEKVEIIKAALEINNGRVPVYVGVGGITTRDSIKLAREAEKLGVDGISVITPSFITPNYEELKKHFIDIAASVKIPVMLYNNVGRTNVDVPPKLVAELSKIDNIVGIKDSSGDMNKMAEHNRLTADENFAVFSGRDTIIFGNLMYGGKGAVAATAGIAPKIVVGIYNAYMEGNYELAKELQYKLTPLRNSFNLTSFPGLMKEALNLMGYNVGKTFAPIGPISEENKEILKGILRDIDLY